MILDLIAVALLFVLTVTVITHIIRDFRRGNWIDEFLGIVIAIAILAFMRWRL